MTLYHMCKKITVSRVQEDNTISSVQEDGTISNVQADDTVSYGWTTSRVGLDEVCLITACSQPLIQGPYWCQC